MADEGAKGSEGKFFVLGDGKVGSNPRLDHHHMAPDPPRDPPACLFKSLNGFFPEILTNRPLLASGW